MLIVDTYEVLRLLDGWIRRSFAPALRDNTRLVLAGREPPVAIWHTAPGWSALVLSVPLGNLAESEAEDFLEREGLDPAAARVNRLACGHPLSLELAAAAVRARPAAALEDIALRAVLEGLTELYLGVLEPPAREALDAASVVRRITLSLLAAMLPERAPQDAFERLRALPFVELGHDGLIVHDTIRETVARALAGSDRPATGATAEPPGSSFRAELPTRRARRGLALHGRHALPDREPRRPGGVLPDDGARVLAERRAPGTPRPSRRSCTVTSRAAAAEHLVAWWQSAPAASGSCTRREGVVGLSLLFEPDRSRTARSRPTRSRASGATTCDEIRCRAGSGCSSPALAERGRGRGAVRRAGRLLARCQALLPGAPPRAAPDLHRVPDLATFAPIVAPLGFALLPEVVQLGERPYHSAVLDFGPSSIDGWLSRLVARELLIDEYSILDPVQRQLVLDERRVDLTSLEFGVLDYLLQHEGKVVERSALLETSGARRRRQQRRRGRHPLAAQEARRAGADDRDRAQHRLPAPARARCLDHRASHRRRMGAPATGSRPVCSSADARR